MVFRLAHRQFTLARLLVATAIVALMTAGVIYFPSAASVLLWSVGLLVWYFWGPRGMLGAAAYAVVFGALVLLAGGLILLLVAGCLGLLRGL